MTQVLTKKLTKEEYFDLEEKSGKRYEFVNGEIIEVEMAKLMHEFLVGNIYALLKIYLRGKDFKAVLSQLKIDIQSQGNYRYADVSVIKNRDVNLQADVTGSPIVLFEVLSKSTESRDRNEKLEEYQSIPSLQEYVLISSEKMKVELYRRKNANEWDYITLNAKAMTLELRSVGFSTTLEEIYEDTQF
jgi:Uma2 family endonuclease